MAKKVQVVGDLDGTGRLPEFQDRVDDGNCGMRDAVVPEEGKRLALSGRTLMAKL